MLPRAQSYSGLLLALSLSGALVFAGGCKTTGYDRAEAASRSMTEVRADLVELKAQVNESAANLDALMNKPQPDLKPQYEAFTKSVAQMKDAAQETRDNALSLKVRRDEYIDTWRMEVATLNNAQIKKVSEGRIEELRKEFDRLNTQGEAAKKAFEPYLAGMTDLDNYLSNDLTMGGLTALKSTANDTLDLKPGVVEELDALIKHLDEVAKQLQAAGPPPDPAPAS